MALQEETDKLQEEIDRMRKEIRTDEYSMSIGEWISMYKDKEVNIHAELPRFFDWSKTQKTKLIESLLLNIPVPQIFVYQKNDGQWIVIDGRRRLATIFEFAGILRDEKRDLMSPLILEGTKYLPSLKDKVWDESQLESLPESNPEISFLTPEQRFIIRRAKISASIILKENGENMVEIFERLHL